MITILGIFGFALAAYAVVANDSIQTLGTFIVSNQKKTWQLLFVWMGLILAGTLTYGYYIGDISYGRLDKFPETEVTWIHVLSPLALLVMTRFGIPVSTTFIVLTTFQQKNTVAMITKSGGGFVVASIVACVLYVIAIEVEKYFYNTNHEDNRYEYQIWLVLQWLSSGFLWWQWLKQDLANIYIFLPRELSVEEFVATLALMLVLLAFILREKGGKIQEIVNRKINTKDIRAATIIDFLFAVVLYIFKEINNIPMSTTFVFIGILSGREISLRNMSPELAKKPIWKEIGFDLGMANAGIVGSLAITIGIPWLLGI